MSIINNQNELLTLFEGLDDELDRYSFLTSLGGRLPEIPEKYMQDEYLVKGCQSRVWLEAGIEDGLIFIYSFSDTLIVRGLLYMIQYCIEGESAGEYKSCEWDIFERAGLTELLTEDRKSGLKSILSRVSELIRQ